MEQNHNEGRFSSLIKKSDDHVSINEAGFFSRFIAFFIDALIIFRGLIFVVFILSAIMGLTSFELAFEVFWLRSNVYENMSFFALFTSSRDLQIHIAISIALILYFVILESKYVWGTTPGKRILKISVIDNNGNKLTLRKSFLRNITKYFLRVPIVGIIFGFLEIFLVMFYSKRTGDIIANTSVASSFHKGHYSED